MVKVWMHQHQIYWRLRHPNHKFLHKLFYIFDMQTVFEACEMHHQTNSLLVMQHQLEKHQSILLLICKDVVIG